MKVWRKFVGFNRGIRNVSYNLWILSPLGFPASLGKWAELLNQQYLYRQISSATQQARFKIKDAIIWISFPGWLPVIKKMNLPPEQVVLHFFDRWEAYGLVDKEKINKLKHALLLYSGAVLASAPDVVNELKQYQPKSYYAPHGINSELFCNDQSVTILPELSNITGPIVGFFGTIDSFWIDFELLKYCAVVAPQISWVFIGMTGYLTERDQHLLEELSRLPNVMLLGKKDYQNLPNYGRFFKAGLLPFKISSLTSSASPLKLLEYLALGLPVISTTLQQYGELSSYVQVAGPDPKQYLQAVMSALEQSPEDMENRMNVVKKYDWPAVIQGYIKNLRYAGIDI